jgi:hypothetical protein
MPDLEDDEAMELRRRMDGIPERVLGLRKTEVK